MGHIVPNVVNYELQKPPLWESDKRITLYRLRLDCGDICLTIQWYEEVPRTVESYIVYRLYYGQLPQFQSHTHLLSENIATTQSFWYERQAQVYKT